MREPSFDIKPASETEESVHRIVELAKKEANEGIGIWTDNLLKLEAIYQRSPLTVEAEQQYAEVKSGCLAQIDNLMRKMDELGEKESA